MGLLKELQMELECDCDAKTVFDVRLPSYGKPTFGDIKCSKCKATWKIHVWQDRWGNIHGKNQLLVGTVGLSEAIAKKKQHARTRLPEKKAPAFYMPPERKTSLH